MAIKRAKSSEEQTELIQESRDEQLGQLLVIETKNQELINKWESYKALANEVKNEIKALQISKSELVNKLNSGQQGLIIAPSEGDITDSEDLGDDLDLTMDDEAAE